MSESNTFEPDWVSPPGDTIEGVLEERGWSKAEFADRTGFTAKHVNELVKGRAPITADAAERLSRVLGSTTEFWLVREAHYRSALERRRVVEEAAADVDWLDELPLAWMRKRGWVENVRDPGAQVIECQRFFGVASVEVWRTYYAAPLFELGEIEGKQIGAVATWLRKGEIETGKLGCVGFDKTGLRAAMMELRGWTSEADPCERIVEVCAAHGVAVAFVPTPPACPVTGATRWLTADKAMLLLSSTHLSNDRLWFTLFHEIAHLLLHGKKLRFIEGITGVMGIEHALEHEANQLANRLLIPDHGVRRLAEMSKDTVTEVQITTLAAELGVAPGILVGRMQAEGWLTWRQLNQLKIRYAWAQDRKGR